MRADAILKTICRPAGAVGVVMALIATMVVGVAVTPAQADPLPGGIGPCKPGDCPAQYPALNSADFAGRDDSVNVFVGGNLQVREGAAEAEGRTVVLGDFDLNKTTDYKGYNTGIAGIGSRVPPPEGSDFLVTGGSITVAPDNIIYAGGGVVRHAGALSGNIDASGAGGVVQDAAATAPYTSLKTQLSEASKCYATGGTTTPRTPTGTAVNAGLETVFTGDGTSMLQVFNVDFDMTAPGGGLQGVVFNGIPAGATVLVNVLGTSPTIMYYMDGGHSDANPFHSYRERLLWNFPDATDVTLGGGGQFQGSILIGNPASTTTNSMAGTNGRFLATGNVIHTSGGGNGGQEFHAYPFTGDLPGCTGVGDYVWLDANNNGVQDAGEAPIAGATVTLKNAAGTTVKTATTDAAGKYLFTDLSASTDFAICFDAATATGLPAGVTAGSLVPTGKDLGGDDATDSDPDATRCVKIKSPATGQDLTFDAGFVPPVAVGDYVWLDANKNGVQDSGDAPIAGTTVMLKNATGATVKTAITDAGGKYLFSDLPANTDYEICFNAATSTGLPTGITAAGLLPTGQDAGGNDATDSDPALNGCVKIKSPATGQNLTFDAGFVYRATGFDDTAPADDVRIGNLAWFDTNADGVQAPGEPGIPGVKVSLKDSKGGVVRTTTTDATGNYLFSMVPPSEPYMICFDAGKANTKGLPGSPSPRALRPTAKNAGGNVAKDSDPGKGGCFSLTTPAKGENDTYDAGFVRTAELTVSVSPKSKTVCVCGTNVYRVKVTNKGGIAARDIAVSVPLPAGAKFIAAASPGWRLAGGKLTAMVKALAPGASNKLKLTLKVKCSYGGLNVHVRAKIADWTDPTGKHRGKGHQAAAVVQIRCKDKPTLE